MPPSQSKPTPTRHGDLVAPPTQDLTAHSEADTAHLYRDMFENALWGIFQTTADGAYLRANPALARIYGYASADEMLSSLTNIERQLYVAPGRRSEFVRLMQECASLSGFESEVYRRDGQIIWITENCREVRDRNGELLYYEGTVEDITLRKLAEQELRVAKAQAEMASRAKSTFLANMSHELRTPLNAVLGFAEIIRDQLMGPLGDERYLEYAGHIHVSAKHLLEVINDILDMTKIENGHMDVREESLDAGDLMYSCLPFVADAAAKNDVELKVEAPAAPVMLLVDEKRLRQILLNLLSNAVKFTLSGGVVRLAATFDAESGGFVFTVTDTGIGMSEAQIAHALEPFRQVDNSLTRRYEGTGIGLPLARSLTELLGGTLTIASRPEDGTSVTVNLPRSRVNASIAA
jgi:PAS domain S-box-containing protein